MSKLFPLPAVILWALIGCGAPVALGQTTQPATPDVSQLDAAALRILVKQLYLRIASLETQVKGLEAQKSGPDAKPEGGWTIKVTVNREPDTAKASADAATLQKKIDDLKDQVQQAQDRLKSMQAETVTHSEDYTGRDTSGHWFHESRNVQVPKYSDTDLAPFRQTVFDLLGEKKRLETQMFYINEDIRHAGDTRIVEGVLPSGHPVIIRSRGILYSTAVNMKAGETYRVDGNSSKQGDMLQVQAKSIVVVND